MPLSGALASLGVLLVLSGGELPGDADFLPVSLSCPSENAGILEVVTQNRAGRRVRYQVKVENGVVNYAARGEADVAKDFDDALVVTTSAMTTSYPDGSVEVELAGTNSGQVAREILQKANTLSGDACAGSPEARRRQAEVLAENRRSLGLK